MKRFLLILSVLATISGRAEAQANIVQCKTAGGSQGPCVNGSIQTVKLVDGASFVTISGTEILTNKTFNCANNTCTVRLGADVTGLLPIVNGGTASTTGDLVATNSLTSPLFRSNGALSVTAAAGASVGTGSVANLVAGAGGSTSGSGGATSVTGGAATAGNSTGGAASLRGGVGSGSSRGGNVTVSGGAGGTNGSGGNVTLTSGSPGAAGGSGGNTNIAATNASSSSNGNGGAIDIRAGNGDGNGYGSQINVVAGNGGIGGSAGGIAFYAGNAGSSSNNDGGTIDIVAGAPGGSGSLGTINLGGTGGIYIPANIIIGGAGSSINLGRGAVTQVSTLSTGVTLNSSSGKITTVSTSLAAGAFASFTVTNSNVKVGSIVLAVDADYSGTLVTNGVPKIKVNNIVNGSFVVTVANVGATSLSGTITIFFVAL